mgnify:CR=1 FL=1
MEARKIIITGGATRIGAAIARKLSGANKEILIHFNKSKLKAEKLKKELESHISETEEEYTELSKCREKVVTNIDQQNLTLYDRVRGAREGVAVVPVVNHACGGCHSRIPSQLEAEIRSGDTMKQCNSCRRILYWEEAEVLS